MIRDLARRRSPDRRKDAPGLNLARESTAPLFANIKSKGRSIWQASETMQEGMSEFGDQLETLQTELPSRFALTSALFVEEKLHDLDLEARLDRIDEALMRTGSISETISSKRALVVDALGQEREAIVAAVSDAPPGPSGWSGRFPDLRR